MDEEQRIGHEDKGEEKMEPEDLRHVRVFVTGVAQVCSGETTKLKALFAIRVVVQAVAMQVNRHHCKGT
jgi:hypothetical protein